MQLYFQVNYVKGIFQCILTAVVDQLFCWTIKRKNKGHKANTNWLEAKSRPFYDFNEMSNHEIYQFKHLKCIIFNRLSKPFPRNGSFQTHHMVLFYWNKLVSWKEWRTKSQPCLSSQKTSKNKNNGPLEIC